MKINPITNTRYSNGFSKRSLGGETEDILIFGRKKSKSVVHDEENPISRTMERLDLMKGAVVAGLGFGARILFEYSDDDTLGKMLNAGQKLANEKYAHLNKYLRAGLGVASGIAIVAGTIGIIGGIYALCQTPKAIYQGGVNAHVKSEEMDVYLKQNRLEQDLYKQVTESAKQAQTPEEKRHAEEQYFLLKQAKTQIPQFINF